jgi:hypothetical protein
LYQDDLFGYLTDFRYSPLGKKFRNVQDMVRTVQKGRFWKGCRWCQLFSVILFANQNQPSCIDYAYQQQHINLFLNCFSYRREHEHCEFDVHEVYAVDVLISSGEGKVSNNEFKKKVKGQIYQRSTQELKFLFHLKKKWLKLSYHWIKCW